ncbi:MAG TPA: sigma factor, partial [Candidatus Dormibacteraeota bacterium]|nr:sigma factor [Candidatus Dormibacteraeota bacterium]
MDDRQLLEDYLTSKSEAAFRTLVERHVGLVHGAAQRHVNNSALAEEITQAVFILLARKAPTLPLAVTIVGWLFRTTRFVASRALRAEIRRQRREQ